MGEILDIIVKLPQIVVGLMSQPMGWFILLLDLAFSLAVLSVLEKLYCLVRRQYRQWQEQRKITGELAAKPEIESPYSWPGPEDMKLPADRK